MAKLFHRLKVIEMINASNVQRAKLFDLPQIDTIFISSKSLETGDRDGCKIVRLVYNYWN